MTGIICEMTREQVGLRILMRRSHDRIYNENFSSTLFAWRRDPGQTLGF